MNQLISRRKFITAAAAGAGIMGGGLLGCSANAVDETGTDSNAWLPATWNYEADVVVVGLGTAGITAAIEAADLGNSVIALDGESEERAGGSTRICGGLMLIQNAASIAVNSFNTHPAGWDEFVGAEEQRSYDWLVQNGLNIMNPNDEFKFAVGNGPAVYAVFKDALDASAVQKLYDTKAVDLIQNPETKEVLGVYAERNGSRIALKANRGVLLATGAFVGNQEFLSEHFYPEAKIYNLSAPYLDGSGHILAFAAGAKIWKSAYGLEFYSMCAATASDEIGTGIVATIPSDAPSAIYLNKAGKRFTDEDVSLIHYKGCPDVLAYKGGLYIGYYGYEGYQNLPCYMVFDEKCFNGGGIGNATQVCTWARWEPDGYVWSDDNKAELDKGWITKADSIEELAGKLDLDPVAVSESIATFNIGCTLGADAFGRVVTERHILDSGPWYGLRIDPGIVYTISGPKFNFDCQALDWHENAIPRLYVVGDISQGQFLNPIGIPGIMGFARKAAQHMTTLEPWKI
jgi:hypothetical protein